MILPILAGCGSKGSPFIQVCEDVLRHRVHDPRSYHRVAFEETSERVSIQAFHDRYHALNGFDYPRTVEAMGQALNRPRQWTGVIRYRAANAFSQPIEKTATCEYIVANDDGRTIHRRENVHVDGETYVRW